jgi:hypothetical protein
MDTIELLAKYNSKETSLVDKITTFTMAACALLYFVSVYFYPLKFSFLLFGLAYILAIFCSPRRNRERIENKIKKSVYCGDLKSIFNLENKRTLQVIKDFKNEIEHDISNYFGLKGETILKMLEEIKVWEKYDLEKTNKADFKEAFENTPTRIGKMFEQINNLKKGR